MFRRQARQLKAVMFGYSPTATSQRNPATVTGCEVSAWERIPTCGPPEKVSNDQRVENGNTFVVENCYNEQKLDYACVRRYSNKELPGGQLCQGRELSKNTEYACTCV